MQKHRVVAQAEAVMQSFLSDLETIVNIDSGTYTKEGVDRVGAILQARFHDFGFSTSIDHQYTAGNNLIAIHQGQAPTGPRILLIGHMDTVFSAGEAARRPFRLEERDGKCIATGPGILDMKAGLLIGMYGLHLLIAQQEANYRSITFICNSDEETSSETSRPLISRLAQEADAVIVLEPGRIINGVVSARKGIGNYRVDVHGISSHAGVDPQKGRNAILEMAYQIVALQAINGTIPGVTLNVGLVRGGERTNVVPNFAYCEIDVRVDSMQGIQAIEAAMHKVTDSTTLDGTRTTLKGSIRSLPFERSEHPIPLVQLVREAGRELGLHIEDLRSGGASDANTTAALGIPTIDGLGATGALAHNEGEYIVVDDLPTRIALFVGLITRLGDYYLNAQ